jgi:6-phosphogluconolactonase (cycloisomerase 2 family)
VLAYSVTPTGTVKAIQGSPFLTTGATNLSAITVSPSGKVLIAADDNLGGAWSFVVNATTSALTLAPGAPFPTGNTPRNLTFDHASKFAYVSCEGTGISGYSINQTNGSLTTVPGSPFALSKHNSLAAGITVDGSGKYVYVEGQSGVDGYKINQLTGALKLLAGSPFANGAGGGSMATDPLGKFVYGVSSVGTTAHTVNSSSGALAQLSHSTNRRRNCPRSHGKLSVYARCCAGGS